MAAKTPVAVGTNGWVRPEKEIYGGTIAAAQDFITDGAVINLDQYVRKVLYFSDIDTTDTYSSGIGGIMCVAVVSKDANATVAPSVGWDAAGVLTFTSSGNDWAGWVILFIDDPRGTHGKRSA